MQEPTCGRQTALVLVWRMFKIVQSLMLRAASAFDHFQVSFIKELKAVS